jgi:sRNA-binding carbon storage regulator CsrA
MLVFTRKNGEAVVVTGLPGDRRLLTVKVIETWGGRVRLGFEADPTIVIDRSEVWDRKNTVVVPPDSGEDTGVRVESAG